MGVGARGSEWARARGRGRAWEWARARGSGRARVGVGIVVSFNPKNGAHQVMYDGEVLSQWLILRSERWLRASLFGGAFPTAPIALGAVDGGEWAGLVGEKRARVVGGPNVEAVAGTLLPAEPSPQEYGAMTRPIWGVE